MPIKALRAFQDNYIWAISSRERNKFICVDPGDATPVISYAEKNDVGLEAILITHHHFDHIGGLETLLGLFPDASVYAPRDTRIPFVTKHVNSNTPLSIAPYQFQILETPGHTSTHICYYERNEHWLFCGDTLFSAGCGRIFDGTIEQLYQSLNLIQTLPNETKLFCAHEYTLNNLKFAQTLEPDNQTIKDYIAKFQQESRVCSLPSTLSHEKKVNPFIRLNTSAIKAFGKQHHISSDDALRRFKLIRELKDAF